MNTNVQILKQETLLGKTFNVYGDFENPLFLAKDVAEWIEHSNLTEMTRSIDDDEKQVIMLPPKHSLVGLQSNTPYTFLTEDGVYEVLMVSRKPIAKKFKKGVKRILKSIRTTGGYIATSKEDTPELIMARALQVAQLTIDNHKRQLQLANTVIQEQAPKVEYHDRVLQGDGLIATNVIAKELGMSAVALNRKLHQKGIIYKCNGTWVLYAKYENKGFTDTKTTPYKDSLGIDRTSIHTYWTEKGRQFIHGILNVKEIA